MYPKTLRLLWIVSALALMPVTAQADLNILWQKQADYIAISTLKPYGENSHPQTLAVDNLARLLSQVQVKDSPYNPSQSLLGDEEVNQHRVFTDREVDLLANKLSEAIAKAAPHEAVVFTVSDFRPSYIGRQLLSVSGTVFVRNNRFNLLLGEMHIDRQLKKLRSGVTGTYGEVATKAEILRTGLKTGDLQQQTEHEWQLVAFHGAEKVNGRSDWLSVDLEQAYEYAVARDQSKSLDDKYLTEQQQEASNDALEARIRKLEQERDTPPAKSAAPAGTIEQRLRKLQALYNSGALPESVYLEKVRTIMSEL